MQRNGLSRLRQSDDEMALSESERNYHCITISWLACRVEKDCTAKSWKTEMRKNSPNSTCFAAHGYIYLFNGKCAVECLKSHSVAVWSEKDVNNPLKTTTIQPSNLKLEKITKTLKKKRSLVI